MGAVVENLSKGWGKIKGVGDVIQGGGAGGTSFWVGDVGYDPLRKPEPGGGGGGFSTG